MSPVGQYSSVSSSFAIQSVTKQFLISMCLMQHPLDALPFFATALRLCSGCPEGAGITNGWRACDHVDSVQNTWLALFWRFWSCIETDRNGRRAIEMLWRFLCQNRNGPAQIGC
jgi:hypothetical protein